MNQMKPDEELRLARRERADGVQVPHFLQECFPHGRTSIVTKSVNHEDGEERSKHLIHARR
jgi:hypothetical protein